jgi:hypothetical protein
MQIANLTKLIQTLHNMPTVYCYYDGERLTYHVPIGNPNNPITQEEIEEYHIIAHNMSILFGPYVCSRQYFPMTYHQKKYEGLSQSGPILYAIEPVLHFNRDYYITNVASASSAFPVTRRTYVHYDSIMALVIIHRGNVHLVYNALSDNQKSLLDRVR